MHRRGAAASREPGSARHSRRAAPRDVPQQEHEAPQARHTATGEVISFVEASNGELKIWTFLNADIPSEKATAGKVCRVAKASGVPEANGALVVDGGDVELQRC